MAERRSSPAFASADSRPRIHIWEHGLNFRWSFGPGGRLEHATSLCKAAELHARAVVETATLNVAGDFEIEDMRTTEAMQDVLPEKGE